MAGEVLGSQEIIGDAAKRLLLIAQKPEEVFGEPFFHTAPRDTPEDDIYALTPTRNYSANTQEAVVKYGNAYRFEEIADKVYCGIDPSDNTRFLSYSESSLSVSATEWKIILPDAQKAAENSPPYDRPLDRLVEARSNKKIRVILDMDPHDTSEKRRNVYYFLDNEQGDGPEVVRVSLEDKSEYADIDDSDFVQTIGANYNDFASNVDPEDVSGLMDTVDRNIRLYKHLRETALKVYRHRRLKDFGHRIMQVVSPESRDELSPSMGDEKLSEGELANLRRDVDRMLERVTIQKDANQFHVEWFGRFNGDFADGSYKYFDDDRIVQFWDGTVRNFLTRKETKFKHVNIKSPFIGKDDLVVDVNLDSGDIIAIQNGLRVAPTESMVKHLFTVLDGTGRNRESDDD